MPAFGAGDGGSNPPGTTIMYRSIQKKIKRRTVHRRVRSERVYFSGNTFVMLSTDARIRIIPDANVTNIP